MSKHVIEINDQNFEQEVLQADLPVLVDFWAPWCGPCKMLGPIVDEIAEAYAGKLKVVKINVDDNSESASNYGVRGIPNLILFKNGNPVANKVGAMPKAALTAFIDGHI